MTSASPSAGSASGDSAGAVQILPKRIAHVGLRARDLERTVAFYEDVLGLHVSDRVPEQRVVFMRLASATEPRDHHSLAIFACDDPEVEVATAGPRLDHVAFELHSFAHLRAAARSLRARGLAVKGVRGGAGGHDRLYFQDPDGHTIELFCAMVVIQPDGIVPPIPPEGPLDFDAPDI